MIEATNLTKYFLTNKAVDDISFTVEKGEILGFLGPNGAGKTTTMRMITGFVPPSKWTAIIGGYDIIIDALSARKKMGYLPENAPVYPDMTVLGYLNFCSEIRSFSRSNYKENVEATIEKCFLSEVKHQTIHTLSKGFKQRVCFAQSILHDPEFLIFDEPTDGLDPNQKYEVRLMIREMSSEKAIILSTHILDEVDAVCSRAIIIADGRIVADDTPANLRAQSPIHGTIALTVANTDSAGLIARLQNLDGVESVKILEDNRENIKVRIFPERTGKFLSTRVMSCAQENNIRVESIFVEQGRLDNVFRSITRKG